VTEAVNEYSAEAGYMVCLTYLYLMSILPINIHRNIYPIIEIRFILLAVGGLYSLNVNRYSCLCFY